MCSGLFGKGDSIGYAQTLNIGNAIILSDTLIASNDANKNITWGTYTLTKSIAIIKEIYVGSALRVKFDIGSGAGTTYGKIYKNGIAVGTEKSKAGASATQTDDITFTDLKANDVIELWTYNNANNGTCANFRLYGTETIFVNEVT